jgi:RNA ligase
MRYDKLETLDNLLEEKLISRRPHPGLPLFIYNYTPSAQAISPSLWPDALSDCRGLILDENGNIVGRPFRKFWNYEQVLSDIPNEPFTVWEKVDGSLGIVCSYNGNTVVATRGSFESDQAKWASAKLLSDYGNFSPQGGLTYLFEIVYPENRIVVDYKGQQDLFLLAVLDKSGKDDDSAFNLDATFKKAKRYDGITDFSEVNTNPRFNGQEGFVVRWENGFRAKIKADEYKRLHKLITQCSTRTIWELLRSGKGVSELVDRVPDEFKAWVLSQSKRLEAEKDAILRNANNEFMNIFAICGKNRKEFALMACQAPNSQLIFGLLDGRNVRDMAWRLVEPLFATPFRKDSEN